MNVLYEDDSLLILDKPHGIPCLPSTPINDLNVTEQNLNPMPTVVSEVAKLLNPELHELGLLHRLDNLTSGCLCFAKNLNTYKQLRSEWKTQTVEKYYRALVVKSKDFNLNQTLPLYIETKIGHSKKSLKKMVALNHPSLERQIRGKPRTAHTEILEIKKYKNFLEQEEVFDLSLKITTGVRHQIRCHLASIGLSILGDPVYSKASSNRLWLHSYRVVIKTAKSNPIQAIAPLPLHWPT